jgi:hypothetical protein
VTLISVGGRRFRALVDFFTVCHPASGCQFSAWVETRPRCEANQQI